MESLKHTPSTSSKGLIDVFFNFIPPISTKNGLATGFESLPIGNSLIASASLRHSTLRFGFDVPIPYYSKAIEKFKNGGEWVFKALALKVYNL